MKKVVGEYGSPTFYIIDLGKTKLNQMNVTGKQGSFRFLKLLRPSMLAGRNREFRRDHNPKIKLGIDRRSKLSLMRRPGSKIGLGAPRSRIPLSGGGHGERQKAARWRHVFGRERHASPEGTSPALEAIACASIVPD